MPITSAQKTTYESELATLQGQRTTAVSNLQSAESSFASARDLRAQRIGELQAIEQKLIDRRYWLQNAVVG